MMTQSVVMIPLPVVAALVVLLLGVVLGSTYMVAVLRSGRRQLFETRAALWQVREDAIAAEARSRGVGGTGEHVGVRVIDLGTGRVQPDRVRAVERPNAPGRAGG